MMDRKKFITSASVMTFASLTNGQFLNTTTRNSGELLPIIDTHQHLCDFERFKVGWCNPPLSRNFGVEDYLKAIKGLNIMKSVYVEVGVPPDKRHTEALYAIELCKDKSNPTVGAVIAADITSAEFEQYISEFKNSPYIKGIRCGFKNPEEMLNDQVVQNVRVLGKMNLSFEFSISPKFLPNMNILVSLCPDTLFIVEHCGNGDPNAFYRPWEKFLNDPEQDRRQWLTGMKAIALKKNIACKISGVVTLVLSSDLTALNVAPVINQCLDIFGPDRVMFAGDWPWCLKKTELSKWVNVLKKVVANRSFEDQKKLFYDNALIYYKI